MLSLELNNDIDAVVQGQPTHIGFVAINTAGEFLITEPKGHPYGVSATFSKVKLHSLERPHQALSHCIDEQVGETPISIYPIPVVWATGNSRGMYFVGLLQNGQAVHTQVGTGLRWRSRDVASQDIGNSQNQESRQRDLGILAAAATICVSPYRRVLLMLRELHRMGFERLRAPAYMYPIAWRCPIVPSHWTQQEHGGLLDNAASAPECYSSVQPGEYTYSSSSEQYPFNWPDVAFASPQELAARFVRECAEIVAAGWGPDREYVDWFERVLEMTKPNGVYYAVSEYEPPTDIIYPFMTSATRIPSPPPGLAKQDEWQDFATRLRPSE